MSNEANTSPVKQCPHCGGTELYTRRMSSFGQYLYLLAGLGRFLHYAHMDVVVCADCGLMRLFAEPKARENVRSSKDWKRLSMDGSESFGQAAAAPLGAYGVLVLLAGSAVTLLTRRKDPGGPGSRSQKAG